MRTRTWVPSPGLEKSSISPPIDSMLCFTRWSPIPRPSPFVEYPFSKICLRTSTGIPLPLSLTSMLSHPASCWKSTSTTLLSEASTASIELSIRLPRMVTTLWLVSPSLDSGRYASASRFISMFSSLALLIFPIMNPATTGSFMWRSTKPTSSW